MATARATPKDRRPLNAGGVVAARQPREIGYFRPRTKVAERRDDGSQGLQPLDPMRVSGASRRDAGIDCLQFLMNPWIRLYLP